MTTSYNNSTTVWNQRVRQIANALASGSTLATDLVPVPLNPPREWFEAQEIPLLPDGGLPDVTVTSEGRVYGYFFEWGQCILGSGISDGCWTPPPSPSGYKFFHQGHVEVMTPDGNLETIEAGLLVPGHSPPGLSAEASMRHYNDPSLGVVVARAYEDERGGYIVGAVVPGRTLAEVAMVQHSALSGHWEQLTVDGVTKGWDCLGPCLVVRPGLPLNVLNAAKGRAATVVAPRLGTGSKEVVAYIGVIPESEQQTAAVTMGDDLVVEEDLWAAFELAFTEAFPEADTLKVLAVDLEEGLVTFETDDGSDAAGVHTYRIQFTLNDDGTVELHTEEVEDVTAQEPSDLPPGEMGVTDQDSTNETEEATDTPPESSSGPAEAFDQVLSHLRNLQELMDMVTADISDLRSRVESLESESSSRIIEDLTVEDLGDGGQE